MYQLRRKIFEAIYAELKYIFEEDEDITVYDDIGDISWSTSTSVLINGLLKDKQLFPLAKTYEMLGIMDRNTYQLCEESNYRRNYIHTSFINFSCFYYYVCGYKDYAASLAKSNYLNQKKEYQPPEKYECVKEFAKVIYLETLGDICIFFDKDKAGKYYHQAQSLFRLIDFNDQRGETCDCYWQFLDDHYMWTIYTCFGERIDFEDDGNKRIEQKKNLFFTLIG